MERRFTALRKKMPVFSPVQQVLILLLGLAGLGLTLWRFGHLF